MAVDKTYIDQWLKTATKGGVTATYAWLTERMTLECHTCGASLTFSTMMMMRPENEIDYSVQEFVKIHAHTGGHDGWQSYNVHYTDLKELEAKVINVDDPKTSISQDLGEGWVSYKMPLGVSGPAPSVKFKNVEAPVIDDSPENAEKIKTQMAKYEAKLTVSPEYYDQKTLEIAYAYIPLGVGPVQHHSDPPPKPAKVDKPLKRVEGRKFR